MWQNRDRVGVCEAYRKLEKNDVTKLGSHTRDAGSRYKSPAPKTRAVSTGRRRSGTPKLPSRPVTQIHDPYVDTQMGARKEGQHGKLADSSWPSRTRSLSVSFQSVTFSVSTSKREKPPPQALSDRAFKSSSNVSQKRFATLPASRKGTPERLRSPLRGKNAIHQSENRLPASSTSSKVLTKSIGLPDYKPTKIFIAPNRNIRIGSEKSASDPASVRVLSSVTDNFRRMSLPASDPASVRVLSSVTDNFRRMSLPASGPRTPSPIKPSGLGSKRPVSPFPIRPSSPLRQPYNSNQVSVLTFVADIKKGRNVADQIEDAHYLRLLYNRQIQWRFVNAGAEAAWQSQTVTTKESLFNVWRSTSDLRDSVAGKRFELDCLRLKLKLYSLLSQQMDYCDEWDSIETEHALALSGSIDDLKSSTLRLPVTEGARVDIESLKSSFYSAIHVMQTIGSSIQSTLSKLKGPNWVANELANVAAQERALLDECELLLVSVVSLQEKEHSLRTHLIQLKQKSQ